MIEINPTLSKQNEKTKIKSNKKSSGVKKSTFDSELKNTIEHQFEGAIEELMSDLKDQEKKFLDLQSLYELERYKALVKKILKMILDDGFQTTTLRRTRRDRSDFTILNEIDEKLIKLTKAITQSNKAFDTMKTIEEIRGLIFDLVY